MRKASCFLTMALCLAASGACREAPAPKTEEPPVHVPKPETGNCVIETLKGPCDFLIAHRLGEGRAPGPEGTGLYRVEFDIREGDKTATVPVGHFRIPDDRAPELREYYRKNSPSKCSATIVHPPCNPSATGASVDIPPPDFAKPERYF